MKKQILILVAFGALCFFIGRCTRQTKEVVIEVKGETMHGTIEPSLLTVKKEFKTDIKFLPYRFWRGDTVRINDIEYIHTIPDTAKIVEDFIKKREYEFNVFDNENGKLDVNQTVQYNMLQAFNYSFTPIKKVVTTHKEPLFTPFVSASYNTFGMAGIGGGLFYKNTGLEYNYLFDIFDRNFGHQLGIKVKF